MKNYKERLSLLEELKRGKRSAVAKAISIIENDQKETENILKKIFKDSGKAIIIGVTGPGGAGKSTLINKTALSLRKMRMKPAILAVDPTSHLSGGAILGDRVRMSESTDSGVYIRSLASRGATGALSRSLRNTIRILEYAGFDPIIIESVGAGQTEVEISNVADIIVVVFNPNTGDNIQTIKAGITEIGDIYLINKSDLSGASQLYDAVRDYIGDSEKKPLVLKTSAKKGTGIVEFAKALKELMVQKRKTKEERDKTRLELELKDIILNNIKERIDTLLETDKSYARYLTKVQNKEIDPYRAAYKITKNLVR